MVKRIVSVQDISCLGQCSLTVALPVLSAMGVETAILPSAIMSTHTGGFQNVTIHDLTEEMPKIVDAWQKEGIDFDAIYTGYIGDARQFDVVLSMRSMLKEGGLLIVDPAMADHGKLYKALHEDIVEGMKKLVSAADVILPNLTEAYLLLGKEYRKDCSLSQMKELLLGLGDLGPRYSIITGVKPSFGKIGAMCLERETGKITEYYTEEAGKSYHGTGDLFASVVVANLVKGNDILTALREGVEFTARSIGETIHDPNHPYGVHFERVLSRMVSDKQDLE